MPSAVVSDSLQPHGLQSTRLLCPWNFPGKNTGVHGEVIQILIIAYIYNFQRTSQVALVVKNSLTNAGDARDLGQIPGSGRSPGGEHGNPLQYSRLENPMDRGACWAIVLATAKNQTLVKQLSTHNFQSIFPTYFQGILNELSGIE